VKRCRIYARQLLRKKRGEKKKKGGGKRVQDLNISLRTPYRLRKKKKRKGKRGRTVMSVGRNASVDFVRSGIKKYSPVSLQLKTALAIPEKGEKKRVAPPV